MNGVRLNKVAVRNDSSPYGPVEFDDRFDGIASNKLGKLGLLSWILKRIAFNLRFFHQALTIECLTRKRFMNSGMLFFNDFPNYESKVLTRTGYMNSIFKFQKKHIV